MTAGPAAAGPAGPPLAPWWPRVGARVVDNLLEGLFTAVLVAGLFLLGGRLPEPVGVPVAAAGFACFGVGPLLWDVVLAAAASRGRGSPGKALCGLRVAAAGPVPRRSGFWRALAREVTLTALSVLTVGLAPLVMCLVGAASGGRAVLPHDALARTVVLPRDVRLPVPVGDTRVVAAAARPPAAPLPTATGTAVVDDVPRTGAVDVPPEGPPRPPVLDVDDLPAGRPVRPAPAAPPPLVDAVLGTTPAGGAPRSPSADVPGGPGPEDESDLTVVRPRSAPPPVGWVLDAGPEGRVVVTGLVLVGRSPVPGDGESTAAVLRLADDNRVVSKTHLALVVREGFVEVDDRASRNGTVVLRDGRVLPVRPGAPLTLREGDVVELGGGPRVRLERD